MDTLIRSSFYSPTHKRLILFCSYFEQEEIPAYVKDYLVKLQPHARKLVFLTQKNRTISTQSVAFLNKHNIELAYVKNSGLDFGMWSRALHHWDNQEYDSLVLANDSCFAIKNLTDLFEIAEQLNEEVVGATESWQHQYHLQSFFLYAKTLASSITIIKFIQDQAAFLDSLPSYSEIVYRCEIGLSKALCAKGHTMTGVWSSKNPNNHHNPTFLYAMELIHHGLPFIKKKFLADSSLAIVKIRIYNRLEFRRDIQISKLEPELTEGLTEEVNSEMLLLLEESKRTIKKHFLPQLLPRIIITYLGGYKRRKLPKCNFDKIQQLRSL